MELLAGFVGRVIGGTIAVGFVSLLVYGAIRKLRPSVNDPLPISCVVAALIAIGMSNLRGLDIDAMLAYAISGFCAFWILRRRFRREAAEDQNSTEEVESDVKEN